MSTDADAQLRVLRERIATVTRQRIRAEHVRDAAIAQAAKARAALTDDFGVSTVDEARAVLADLDRDLADDLRALDDALTQIGA